MGYLAKLFAACAVLWAALAVVMPAVAVEIEIIGGGNDRLERQRAFQRRELPLPGTPDVSKLKERLEAAGAKLGDAIFMRIFKAESELELWLRKGERFELFATYPICQWSGILGPKFYEGDNQSPEGFYTVARNQMNWRSRHRRAFNLNFPNPLDKSLGRTGSHILVHGGCSTEGCFAMTNDVIDEIFRIAIAALNGGQKQFQVQVMPFRMDVMRLMRHAQSPWFPFWLNLKTGHDLFMDTGLPPVVKVCRNRYAFEQGDPLSNGEPVELADCDPNVSDAERPTPRFVEAERRMEAAAAEFRTFANKRLADKALRLKGTHMSTLASTDQGIERKASATPNCNINLPSCRRFVALKARSELAAMPTRHAPRNQKTRVASTARAR